MPETTDGREAKEAVRRSREKLAQVKQMDSRASRIVTKLKSHLQEDNFAKIMDEAYGRGKK